jgi:hypothetical protein
VLAIRERAVRRGDTAYDIEQGVGGIAFPVNLIALSEAHDCGNLGKLSPLVFSKQLVALSAWNPWVNGKYCRSCYAPWPDLHSPWSISTD